MTTSRAVQSDGSLGIFGTRQVDLAQLAVLHLDALYVFRADFYHLLALRLLLRRRLARTLALGLFLLLVVGFLVS